MLALGFTIRRRQGSRRRPEEGASRRTFPTVVDEKIQGTGMEMKAQFGFLQDYAKLVVENINPTINAAGFVVQNVDMGVEY